MLEEPTVPREGRSMSGGRIWRIGAPVVAFIASGGVALLVGIVVAMPIDLLMDRKRSLFSALPRLRRWGGWRSKGYQRPLVCSRSNTIVIRNSPPARSSTLVGSRATPAVAAFGSSATFTGAASHLSSTVLDLRMAEATWTFRMAKVPVWKQWLMVPVGALLSPLLSPVFAFIMTCGFGWVLVGYSFTWSGHAILVSPASTLIPITIWRPIVVAIVWVSITVGIGITIIIVVIVWCRGNRTAEEAKAKPEADRRANAQPATATMVPTAAVTPSSTMPAPSPAIGKGRIRRGCQQRRGGRQRYPTSTHFPFSKSSYAKTFGPMR